MFEGVDVQAVIVLIVALAGVAIYRYFFQRKSVEEEALEKEYQEVLTLDKHKVKGQW